MSDPAEETKTTSLGPWLAVGALAVIGIPWLLSRRSDPEAKTIRGLAEELEREGAIVFTDLAGSPRPPNLGGHIPDIFAVIEDGGELAVEVENERSVTRPHARKQDKAFKKWAAARPNRHYEQLVVRGGRGGRK